MAKENQVTIRNIKNYGFRQVHVDGAHGGVTPLGYINLNFYSERYHIPKSTEGSFNEEQSLGSAHDIDDSKPSIVREFEFGIYMDADTCRSLKEYLEHKLSELDGMK